MNRKKKHLIRRHLLDKISVRKNIFNIGDKIYLKYEKDFYVEGLIIAINIYKKNDYWPLVIGTEIYEKPKQDIIFYTFLLKNEKYGFNCSIYSCKEYGIDHKFIGQYIDQYTSKQLDDVRCIIH